VLSAEGHQGQRGSVAGIATNLGQPGDVTACGAGWLSFGVPIELGRRDYRANEGRA